MQFSDVPDRGLNQCSFFGECLIWCCSKKYNVSHNCKPYSLVATILESKNETGKNNFYHILKIMDFLTQYTKNFVSACIPPLKNYSMFYKEISNVNVFCYKNTGNWAYFC